MDKRASRLNDLLTGLVDGLGITGNHAIVYDSDNRFFSIGTSGIEVALDSVDGRNIWRVLEIYDVNNFENGELDPFGATVAEIAVGDEPMAAKTAVMRLLERRIDAALEEII